MLFHVVPKLLTSLRRRRGVNLSPSLHASDRDFAHRQSKIVANSIAECFNVTGMWINPSSSANRAGYKPLQLKYAEEAGLRIPRTLISNSPTDVEQFAESVGGQVAIKPLVSGTWTSKSGSFYQPFTKRVSKSVLKDLRQSIPLAPAIYQEYVEKKCELRVVVMGNTFFAAQLETQTDPNALDDWRLFHSLHGLTGISRTDIPAHLEQKCLRLMNVFGLVFGSIDIIQTNNNDFVFLEINQMGQFLLLETCKDFSLLSAFCDFVESGDPLFQWAEPSTTHLRYENFVSTKEYARHMGEESEKHEPIVVPVYPE